MREQLITELLDAAWLRVEHGPVERERSCGPFDMESLGGSAALAAADLVACERHAHTQELPDENASVELLLDMQLARFAADAASSLIAFARALAYAIGQPRTGSREGLGPLLSKAISRDLDTLSFDTAPHSYDDAVESLGRITDALINHGPASLGPIIIIAPATDAIANVIAVTVASASGGSSGSTRNVIVIVLWGGDVRPVQPALGVAAGWRARRQRCPSRYSNGGRATPTAAIQHVAQQFGSARRYSLESMNTGRIFRLKRARHGQHPHSPLRRLQSSSRSR